MSTTHDPKLVDAVDSLLRTAIEQGDYYGHVDDLYEPFRGVSNWLQGALETFDVAIEACRTCDTPFTVAMGFYLDADSPMTENVISTLEEMENAFDHSTTGSPPELYLFGLNSVDLQEIRQSVAMKDLPDVFPGVQWYYQVLIDDWGHPHRAVWMIVDARSG